MSLKNPIWMFLYKLLGMALDLYAEMAGAFADYRASRTVEPVDDNNDGY